MRYELEHSTSTRRAHWALGRGDGRAGALLLLRAFPRCLGCSRRRGPSALAVPPPPLKRAARAPGGGPCRGATSPPVRVLPGGGPLPSHGSLRVSPTPAPPAPTGARRCCACSRDERLSRSSGAGTTTRSRRWWRATSRGCWRSAGTCSPRARTRRTCCRRSSRPRSTRCSPTSARSTCARGCTGSRATARSTTCAARRRSAWTRWTSTCPRAASRPPTRSTSARSSGS